MRNRNGKLLACILAIIFFVIGMMTIFHYGINWDEPAHFLRGYAYLDSLLYGGNENAPLSPAPRRSLYHSPIYNTAFWFQHEGGHPAVGDYIFAGFNKIFYELLGILPDMEAYSVTGIVLASLFAYIFASFVIEELGIVGGIVATLAVLMHPLFISEMHFNIKDPPEMIFFGTTLIYLFRAVTRHSVLYMIIAGIAFGLAIGVKFNALFLPFIAGLWIAYYLIRYHRKLTRTQRTIVFSALPVTGIIGIGFFILL